MIVILWISFTPILVVLLAYVIYVLCADNCNVDGSTRTKGKEVSLNGGWNKTTHRTLNGSENKRGDFFEAVRVFTTRYILRRRNSTFYKHNGLWRTWDENSDTCSENSSSRVVHYCYSSDDEYDEDSDDKSIDEGIIVPGKEFELETIYEEKERRGSF